MATNSTLWWWPKFAALATEIDLLGGLQGLSVTPAHKGSRRESLGGKSRTTLFQNRRRVSVKRKFTIATTSVETLNDLKSLEDHLNRGGWVSVAQHRDKAWAGYIKSSKHQGQTVIRTAGNPFWNAAATIAVGDTVCVQSFGPEGIFQQSQVTVVASQAKITISPGLHEEHRGDVLIRHESFFPYLRLPPGNEAASILSNDRRHVWTLDMDLIEDVTKADLSGLIAAANFREGLQPRTIFRREERTGEVVGVKGRGSNVGAFGTKIP